ncbi:MAG: glycosyltransferase family 39 protein [Chloroflexota bacterium]|nr:glycosyltransferase family 39 protein [Chloroflexota bacterium]
MTTNPNNRLRATPISGVVVLIVFAYLALGAAYAVRTPAWQAPDEPAHYNYIAQVAAQGCCPIIRAGDYDQAYLDTLRGQSFALETLARLDSIEYEDHQPPLYYLLASIPYALFDGSLTAIRLLSVVLGAGSILCAFGIARTLYPARAGVGLAAAALIAFVPQRLAIMASVNNDALADLLVGLALLTVTITLRSGRLRGWIVAGGIVGIGFLTKTTIYWLAGVVPLAILAGSIPPLSGTTRGQRGEVVRRWIAFLVPALAFGALWWARNLGVYGGADFLGLAAHDAVVVGQPRTAALIAEVGTNEYLRRAFQTTFNSFWGQFGWMARPLPTWAYALIGVLILVAVVGWLISVVARPGRMTHAPNEHLEAKRWRRAVWVTLIAALALTTAQMIIYNVTFIQFQGRYLFPALIPIALVLALGWDTVAGWVFARIGRGDDEHPSRTPLRDGAAALFPVALIALNLFVIWRELPALAP